MDIEKQISNDVKKVIETIFNQEVDNKLIQIQKNRTDFEGHYTLVVFPLIRIGKKKPEELGEQIGKILVSEISYFNKYNVVKGFLNLSLTDDYWLNIFTQIYTTQNFGIFSKEADSKRIMIEYSSPNTNKPLHLGHIRNNLLGFSVARIIEACGNEVIKVNLVNDRGIHICKSMLAWQKWGNSITPEQKGVKGDKLVGDFYVMFDKKYKEQIKELISKGYTEDEAKEQAPLMQEARKMLLLWEAKDKGVRDLWQKMNNWVYSGFDETYKNLGIVFDKIYYESETYSKGKDVVIENLQKGVLVQRDDKSIWADLTADGLDEKILLRSDGTSVYMTQDIGTAIQRFTEFEVDEHIYVVGNEQDYHFKVLALVLKKMRYEWADRIFHLSYGMVELPTGKMKSREGTVVDADDLIATMVETAAKVATESGKLSGFSDDEVKNIHKTVALGALKYFMLKIDPKRNMMFNPTESIDFNGNTGPFIQYTYARIQSLTNKANSEGINWKSNVELDSLMQKENMLVQSIAQFPQKIKESGAQMNPAVIANYLYELVKSYNQFYHDHSVLKEENTEIKKFRLQLSDKVGQIIKTGMWLLGADVPERM